MNASRESLIIDCDPGHDDMIAILLAHHVADVKGITTVSGNATLEATTANALLTIELLNVDTPVHSGASEPIVAPAVRAEYVHGADGLGGVTRIAHDRTIESDRAVEYLLDAPTKDDWIVAVGPLTNLALVLEKDPKWCDRIRGISIMGGSTAKGNVTAVAEFNIYADPEAAARVLECGAYIRLCGLNLTHQFIATDSTLAELTKIGSAKSDFVTESFTFVLDRMEALRDSRAVVLHDPCAVLAVTHPEIFDFEALSVRVELDGSLTRGMTVVDQRSGQERESPNVEVAQTIDSDKAMSFLLEALA